MLKPNQLPVLSFLCGALSANIAAAHEAECINGFAGTSPCLSIDLLAHVHDDDISLDPGNAADIWGVCGSQYQS